MTDDGKVEPCILPFVNFATNPFGKSRPCGYSKLKSNVPIERSTIQAEFNNELFKSVRRDFVAGKWPENCERCRYMEEHRTGQSKKHSERPYFLELKHLIANTQSDGTITHFPRHIDIRVGTVCNLKCIHCGTGNSTKWLEDKDLLGKYPNTQVTGVDDSWSDEDTPVWDEIFAHLPEIEKFNFIGGEPFASKPHNRLLERMADSPHASRIILHYVTNGTLLTPEVIERLRKFRQVTLNISFDASGEVLEFFRFPIRAARLTDTIQRLEREVGETFDVGLQWTSSNISIFYLAQTLDFTQQQLPRTPIKFCNFVDYPAHMSPQTLPRRMKERIVDRLTPYLPKFPAIEFYLKHMLERDLWDTQGETFLNYLDDLSRVRNVVWRESLSAMADELHLSN